ncbi:protein C2-DOMAIN ABA-RELATED 7-like [Impatiens glandulifera]|uniref:protein C2-DOMAIN ABA-RELATED 7-like n=1 Tax=Impatiens glandulifera TaxID=253017 RepID=UPI001FB0794A|nr:protein C2-DOMAIN ABA-RELATED 7-like [Impatiens glandulifera]
MEKLLGLLRIRVRRGMNLVVHDTLSSDPFVVVSMADQKMKSVVVHDNCNPEWNDELTLAIEDPNVPIILSVYDKDTFTPHDNIGEVEIDIKAYMEAMNSSPNPPEKEKEKEDGGGELDDHHIIKRVEANTELNSLVNDSCVYWIKGKLVQDMHLRLKNVKTGEVLIQIEWIHLPPATNSPATAPPCT